MRIQIILLFLCFDRHQVGTRAMILVARPPCLLPGGRVGVKDVPRVFPRHWVVLGFADKRKLPIASNIIPLHLDFCIVAVVDDDASLAVISSWLAICPVCVDTAFTFGARQTCACPREMILLVVPYAVDVATSPHFHHSRFAVDNKRLLNVPFLVFIFYCKQVLFKMEKRTGGRKKKGSARNKNRKVNKTRR